MQKGPEVTPADGLFVASHCAERRVCYRSPSSRPRRRALSPLFHGRERELRAELGLPGILELVRGGGWLRRQRESRKCLPCVSNREPHTFQGYGSGGQGKVSGTAEKS